MPSGPSWSLRRAAAEDAGPVRGLALATFREAFAHAMPAPTLERLLAERFSEARFQDLIAEPEGRFFLAEAGSEQLGYALTHPARTPEAPGASWELSRLYVRRAFHGQGVGEALMAACVDAARAGGATGMWLKVWELNPRGLAFYRRWGFREAGREDLRLDGAVLAHLILERTC